MSSSNSIPISDQNNKLNGKLSVKLFGARNLKDVQTIGKQDPFCVVKCGKESFHSQPHNDGGKSATWNYECIFNIQDQLWTDLVKFTVKDKEIVSDETIGAIKIQLYDLILSHGPKWIVIRDTSDFEKVRGEILVEVKWQGTGGPK
jgi:Ca2+-dependent lipid-binding protein